MSSKKEETKKNLRIGFEALKDLDGNDLPQFNNCSKFIAQRLASSDDKQDFLPLFNISTKLYNEGIIEGQEDFEKVEAKVKAFKLPVGVKAQIILKLQNSTDIEVLEDSHSGIHFNFQFKDLGGKDIPNLPKASKLIAQHLFDYEAGEDENDFVLKYYSWAKRLNENRLLVLDNSDLTRFKNLVRDKLHLTNIAKAQMFNTIDEQIKEKENK